MWKTFGSCIISARFSSRDAEVAKPFDAMPGHKPLPFIGNSWELKNNLSRINYYYQESFEKYGDIYRLKTMGM